MFVQQFVNVEEPLDRAVARFEHQVAPQLSAIVDRAWRADGHAAHGRGPATVHVLVGGRRQRPDGVVYALSWPSDGDLDLPELDADLELAELAPGRTHVQLSGQSTFPGLVRWSDDELRAQRRCMSGLAAVLAEVAREISATPAGTPAAPDG
jgi:hypothetical protein